MGSIMRACPVSLARYTMILGQHTYRTGLYSVAAAFGGLDIGKLLVRGTLTRWRQLKLGQVATRLGLQTQRGKTKLDVGTFSGMLPESAGDAADAGSLFNSLRT